MAGARKRIVILGGGFAGAYCAQALESALRRRNDLEVVLIDRHNYFVFSPLLVEAGVGGLEPRHVVVPMRDFVRRCTFRMAEVRGIDAQKKVVHFRIPGESDQRDLSFDHLVIALGSVSRLPDIPGLREHAFELKSLGDAVALRDQAVQMLEYATAIDDAEARRRALTFVVIGANYTGVEVAGEFDEFIKDAARRYPNLSPDDCRVMLVEKEPRILGTLDEDLATFAQQSLEKRGVDVRLNTSLKSIDATGATLSTDELVPSRTVIWAAGVAPSPLLEAFDLPLDGRGALACERDLRVRGESNIWAIGDAASNPGPDGQPYPATAQHATRQGKHLARNLLRAIDGRPTQPCDLVNQGSLAALGCRTGVAKIFGVKLSGFPAWWVWRTVYLLKMPRLARKLRVAMDWTLALFFRRDIVELGVHRRTSRTNDDVRKVDSNDDSRAEVAGSTRLG